ncbi:DUF5686 and carboxypeptidase regulatory-like domain-containing protein [Fulvivirgaceae bacterium BMA12]|uniref:DUF5686 and carboxypeptidase regulatory-like domain-containing protein n=1 Tax=Agaribacillus aureus TaxID=3051825 RepID=A0ABT8L8N7_9BACT|nr:DUF5686 and carboxypeptidase regulatory-like domain-containing protein [Fulvivirgaceae bacterium BMA12]
MKKTVTLLYYFSIALILFCLNTYQASAAKIFGRVMDEDNQGLPFATLYLKNTSIGTTTNAEGNYSLEVSPGKYEVVFQFVGYKKTVRAVTVGSEDIELNVNMATEVTTLKEVVVNAQSEDPAYAIIRKTIKKRKYYQKEVSGYDCKVYIKGLQRLDERPEKIFGFNVTIDTGIVYLSESVSEFSFRQPDKIKETMISSKVSGSNNAFSFNQASEMMFSFYDNILDVEGISERGFVSPIATNALIFYRYQLEGTFMDGNQLVNKIRVTPIRKSDPVFSGLIYINEDSWRIHSVDLLLTKANQIEFVDSLRVNQVYAPVENDRWMLLSQRFKFQFKALGFKGSGYFISIHSNYHIEKEHEKKYFTNEIMSVSDGANKRDSLYWQKIRPIPLTHTEIKDYHVKDSLSIIKESKPYKDSIDRKSNELSIGGIMLAGYTYSNSFKKHYFTINPVISAFQFNTVEGLVTNLNLSYTKHYENNQFFRITPDVRYGFSSNDFYGQIEGFYYYRPKKFSYVSVKAGKYIYQFDPATPISPLINSYTTLVEEKNFMKVYEKAFVRFRHRSELWNGVLLTTTLAYEDRKQLFNTTSYTFRDQDDKIFTPNAPVNTLLGDTSFPDHQALIIGFDLRLRFAQKYISRPNRKVNLGSKYPTVTINYRKAIDEVLGSDVKYDLLQLSVDDRLNFGLFGSGNYRISGGTFIQNDKTYFMDFKHFNGNQTSFSSFEPGNFQLLDYYLYSTNNNFFKAHYEHHFNGFIINKLPLLRKTRVQAVSSLNYLKTSEVRNYLEFGVGLEHIFKVLRVDYYLGFLSGKKIQNGFRIGVGF